MTTSGYPNMTTNGDFPMSMDNLAAPSRLKDGRDREDWHPSEAISGWLTQDAGASCQGTDRECRTKRVTSPTTIQAEGQVTTPELMSASPEH